MIDFEQNRFFKTYGMDSPMVQTFVNKFPLSECLFVGDHMGKDWYCQPGDPDLLCHELGHCMELMQRGGQDKMLLNNYGWPRIQEDKWTLRMAETECKVFAFQWLLEEYCSFPNRENILTIQFVPQFLAYQVRNKEKENYLKEVCEKQMEFQRPTFVALLEETVQFMVKSFDFVKQTV